MKTIQLSDTNDTLRLEGSEATRSLDLKSVTVNEWPAAGGGIKLLVLDEKDVPIYSQLLEASQSEHTVAVDKRFVFYDHLSVQVKAPAAGSTFSVVIHFE